METHLDQRFSVPGATATSWEQARDELARAETYWLSTVRADGRPHVTPLIAVWHEGALYFSTGPGEQKARNLETNRRCALTTGASSMREGLDLVVEGVAVQVSDSGALKSLADAFVAKYGEEWRFEVRDGAFHSEEGGRSLVFGVAPVKALGFRKGAYAQTSWRF